ncbi:MAG: hypothetical protein AAF633_27315 [Chloroflexota bacterium]
MHVLKRMPGTRVASTETALNAFDKQGWPKEAVVMRFAPDELFVLPPVKNAEAIFTAVDIHAIVMREGSFSGVWINVDEALDLLERKCEWEIPERDEWPAFAQGAVAGLPTKLYFTQEKVLFMVPSPYAHEMEERLV